MRQTLAKYARRRLLWILAGIAALGLLSGYGLLLWQAPWLVLGSKLNQITDASQRSSAEYNARVLMVSVAGALVVSIGLAFTARTYALNQRGQINERFSKALERLGSPEVYVRLGGVHALEHLMADSAAYHADVLEVLTAFVRQRAPRARSRKDLNRSEVEDLGRWVHPPTHYQPLTPISEEPDLDVQAALTAIGRRPSRAARERSFVNLSGLELFRSDLSHASLLGANLTEANLAEANLFKADLSAAGLRDAGLRNAYLGFADLGGADLTDADLSHTNLSHADLSDARLNRANLRDALLNRTNLKEADLALADLSLANLFHADLTGAHLTGANLRGADLSAANLSNSDLKGADLTGAELLGANLAGADLTGAKVTDAELEYAYLSRPGSAQKQTIR